MMLLAPVDWRWLVDVLDAVDTADIVDDDGLMESAGYRYGRTAFGGRNTM